MHGQRRTPPGEEDDEKCVEKIRQRNAKAAKVSAAVKAVIKARAAGDYGQGVMMGTQAVLAVFPDMFSLWNVRREALKLQLDEADSNGRDICGKELALVKGCLAENPKSYSAWHHRRWVIELGLVPLDKELEFVEEFLHPTKGDAKNFHAWRYRFWLVARMHRSDEDELTYCQSLIEADRSNFSAWHYRSVLLPRVHAARGHLSLEELRLQDTAHAATGYQDQVASSTAAQTSDALPLKGNQIVTRPAPVVTSCPERVAEPATAHTSSASTLEATCAGDVHAPDSEWSREHPKSEWACSVGVKEGVDDAVLSGGAAKEGPSGSQQQATGRKDGAHLAGAVGARGSSIPLYELQSELNFVYETLVVSPGDSSVWSYHRWLAHMVTQHGTASSEQAKQALAMLEAEESRAAGLAATEKKRLETSYNSLLEGGSLPSGLVWPLQMCAELSALHRQMSAGQAPDVAQARIAKEMEWYTKLTQLDPRRKGYYEDQIASLKTII